MSEMDIYEFKQEIERIRDMGWIQTHRAGDTGIGKTLEDLLGIEENNIDLPDLGETGELKAVRKNSSSLLTLFTLEPVRELSWKDFVKRYGYIDKKGRWALKSTFYTNSYNSQGLIARVEGDRINIYKDMSGVDELIGYYDIDTLSQKFTDKIGNSLVYVPAQNRGSGVNEEFWYDEAYLYKDFSPSLFLDTIKGGNLAIDFRVHLKPSGAGRSRGTGLRIRKELLDDVYVSKERIM